jgi:ketosteroid isomerase-like protein
VEFEHDVNPGAWEARNNQSMDANISIVQKAYADFGAGNIEALVGAMSENVEWTEPAGGVAPFAGTHVGRPALMTFFRSMGELVQALEFEPQEFVAHGDRVIVLGRYKFVAKVTGKAWETDWVMIWTIVRGQIRKFQIYKDTGAEVEAFRL